MIEYDPDMRNAMPYFRKSNKLPITSQTLGNQVVIPLLIFTHMIYPGAASGQALSYHTDWVKNKIMWGMKLPDSYSFSSSIGQYTLSALFICTMIRYAGIYTIFHMMGSNVLYFIGSSPDHDLFPTHLETENFSNYTGKNKNMDWGEQQVRSSADFCRKSWFVTRFMGGINYQIEHHLFPSLNNVFLKEISPIVQSTCAEFNIPYNFVDNPRDAFNELCKTYLGAASSGKSDSGKSDSGKSESNEYDKTD